MPAHINCFQYSCLLRHLTAAGTRAVTERLSLIAKDAQQGCDGEQSKVLVI
jgi:hypothetical protein